MKFLICILFMFSLNAQANVCSESASFMDASGTVQHRVECYDKVTNTEANKISAGAVVVLNTVSDDAVGVSLSTTAGAVPHCIMEKDCAAGAKNCKCIKRGYASNVLFDGGISNSAGHLGFISESTSGNIQATTKTTISASDVPLGVFLDTGDSAGAVEFYINIP